MAAFHQTSPGATGVSLPRRKLLQIGGSGFLGLTVPRLLAAAEQTSRLIARAKSVIFLFQFGGPSHIDTFDLKPDAPDGVRSEFDSIATSLPGLRVCDQLPRTAKVMDKVTLVHSVHHTMKNHNSAAYYALTGHAPPVDDIRLRDSPELYPAYGATVDRFATNTGGMPTFAAFPHVIADGSITPGQAASFLGRRHDPLLITRDPNEPEFGLPELSLPQGLSVDRLADRRGLQQVINSQLADLDRSAPAAGLDSYYDKALGMLNSTQVRDAFDLSREPAAVRDRYGRTTYGQSCLLARRLVEAGVKFVNVYFAESIGGRYIGKGGWDTHGFDNTRMYPVLKGWQLPLTEQTLPTLLIDLDERGLLDETLVVWMGEFGRTPQINKNVSRDHWPQCYTALLAGGGVKRGFRYGASDAFGAYPAGDPVRPDDLAATMFALLGIDPHTEVRDSLDRPLPIAAGEVLHGILA
jgi:hypothetical protein